MSEANMILMNAARAINVIHMIISHSFSLRK
jgi:hypothetical protein